MKTIIWIFSTHFLCLLSSAWLEEYKKVLCWLQARNLSFSQRNMWDRTVHGIIFYAPPHDDVKTSFVKLHKPFHIVGSVVANVKSKYLQKNQQKCAKNHLSENFQHLFSLFGKAQQSEKQNFFISCIVGTVEIMELLFEFIGMKNSLQTLWQSLKKLICLRRNFIIFRVLQAWAERINSRVELFFRCG